MSDLASLNVEKREWEELLDSPKWQQLTSVLQQQTDALQQEVVFTPCRGFDECLEQEFKKGKMAGMLNISVTIQGILASLEIDIQHAKENKDAPSTDD